MKLITIKQLQAELAKERYDVKNARVLIRYANDRDGPYFRIRNIVFESGENEAPPTIYVEFDTIFDRVPVTATDTEWLYGSDGVKFGAEIGDNIKKDAVREAAEALLTKVETDLDLGTRALSMFGVDVKPFAEDERAALRTALAAD